MQIKLHRDVVAKMDDNSVYTARLQVFQDVVSKLRTNCIGPFSFWSHDVGSQLI